MSLTVAAEPVDTGDPGVSVLAALDAQACADLAAEALRLHVLELHELRARVDGALSAAAGALDARGVWAADGARSGAGWLAARVDATRGRCAAEITLARELRTLPIVAAAALAGVLGRVKVELLVEVRTPELAELVADQEQFLVDEVARLTVREAAVFLRHWQCRAREAIGWIDPDDRRDPPEAPPAAIDVTATFEGRWVLDGEMDAEHGAIVSGVLAAEVDEMFRVGVFSADDGLTARQRRGLALVQVLLRHGQVGMRRGELRPSVEVVADARTAAGLAPVDAEDAAARICEIRGAGPITTAALGRFLCTGRIHRLVFDAAGEPLDLGRDVELATRAQRRALRFQTSGCGFPGCSAPPEWCEAHHITWRDDDGPTDLANLVLLCRFHHHRVHDDGYHLARAPDGTLEVLRPGGTEITPTRGRRRSHHPDPTLEAIRARADDLARRAATRAA